MSGNSSYILLGIAAIVAGLLISLKSYADFSLNHILELVPMIGMAVLGVLFTSLSVFEAMLAFIDTPGPAEPRSTSGEQ